MLCIALQSIVCVVHCIAERSVCCALQSVVLSCIVMHWLYPHPQLCYKQHCASSANSGSVVSLVFAIAKVGLCFCKVDLQSRFVKLVCVFAKSICKVGLCFCNEFDSCVFCCVPIFGIVFVFAFAFLQMHSLQRA